MKKITLLIGIMLALVVCITPVAAVSADDFEVVIEKSNICTTYKYRNKNNSDDKYIEFYTDCTYWLNSFVTFKPANIPDAPVMVVDTNYNRIIYLPYSIDDWEIKYYSKYGRLTTPTPKYLKSWGVVNLNEYFKGCISEGLLLELSFGQRICSWSECKDWFFTCETSSLKNESNDFKVDVIERTDWYWEYNYCHSYNQDEKYFKIFTLGTHWLNSLVTFKPANIPDAPVMVVDTDRVGFIYLPHSIVEWEIKYYSNSSKISEPDDKYIKSWGVVNLNEKFEKYINKLLLLELSIGHFIAPASKPWKKWSISSAKLRS